jgi:hypothetical protein
VFTNIYGQAILLCGHNILTEGVFVIQLFSNGGISVGRIVWIMANCCLVTDILITFLAVLINRIFYSNVTI